MTQAAPHQRLGLPALLGFSLPNVCVGALAVGLSVYLPRYYAGHFGLGLATVGLAFMTVRLVDMALDPFIGILMDRTHTAFGRYRLWLAIGAPALAIPVYMLFAPPVGVNFAYLLGWLFVYYIGLSLLTLSHSAWASVIASDYNERSRVFGAMQMVGVLGAVAVLLIPIVMSKHDGSSGSGDVANMGAFIVLSALIGAALALMSTKESVVRDLTDHKFGARDYWEMISRPDMRRIIIADFCLALGPGWMSALYIFYFHDARGFTVADASKLLLVYVAAGVLGSVVLSWLAQKIGKHVALMLASTGYSLGLIGIAFLPKGAFGLGAVAMFVMGFLAIAFPLLDRAMVADVGDAVRLEQGKNRVSLLYAMITTSQKIAGALSIGFSFTVLGWIGYNAKEGAANTPAAIFGMEMVYIIAPVVFVMLGGACFIGYKLNASTHAGIREKLQRRDALIGEAPILESLSGDQGVPSRIVEPS